MPGMGGSKIQLNNPLVVSIFRHALFFSSVLWILGIGLAVLLVATLLKRVFMFNLSEHGLNEARSRTYLRWGFGALWLFDGLLQFQASMPLGLANGVVAPATAGTPSWLHALMFTGIGVWNNHPIALAVGTAWVQVGIGTLLLVSNGAVGRATAVLSVGWATMIWVVGNGAGGIFSTTSSILFGWPGASLFYAVAGIWLALPNAAFEKRFSKDTTRAISALLVLAAVLQCVPGREFWHGGNSNAVTAMATSMTQFAQPHWIAWVVLKGGTVAGTLGGGFNLIVVLWLLVCAGGLWRSTIHPIRWPVWTLAAGCLVFWVVGEDIAIFGGLATDVNSLLPLAILACCAAPSPLSLTPRVRHLPREMRSSSGAVAASFATAMVVFSIASMGWATLASAENTIFLAQNGPASAVNSPASPFTLTDQHGSLYRLGEHPGHFTLLTFLDPLCYTDCPLLANQLKSVRAGLPLSAKLDMVAVAANPYHETLANLNHFIALHGLGAVKDFYFVTDTALSKVAKVWSTYGISVEMKPTDKMSIHSDYMFIIAPNGNLKWIVADNPLSNWAGGHSAVIELLTLLHRSGLR